MKKYLYPEVSVVKFDDRDVICAASGDVSFTIPSDPSKLEEGNGDDGR